MHSTTWGKWGSDLAYRLSGWGPFIDALQTHYKTRDSLPALIDDPNLPHFSLKDYFVNLTLTDKVQQELEERALTDGSAAAEAALEQGEFYSTLLLKECRNVDALFDTLERGQLAGWISITGRAGTGKTTLLQYVAYRWGSQKNLWHNRFDFVFQVNLKLLEAEPFWEDLPALCRSKLGLGYLAWSIYQSLGNSTTFSIENILLCLEKYPNELLLLLDGYDEIQSLYNTNKRVKDFIDYAMDSRNFPNGILTSRPNAVPLSWRKNGSAPRFSQELENLGLTESNVISYVQRYFDQQSRSAETLLNALSTHVEMMRLAQIPFNIAALCLTWEDTAVLPKTFTMTILYHRVILWLARRYAINVKKTPPEELDIQKIPENCQSEINVLCTLAYQAFMQSETKILSVPLLKNMISLSQLKQLRQQFGLLRQVSTTTINSYVPHYFVHLTYQEYFVAFYIAQQFSSPSSKNRILEIERRQTIQMLAKIIQRKRDNPRYKIIWTFLAGLVSMPEYSAGANYFWDASYNQSDQIAANVIIGFHPQVSSIQFFLRESFLTSINFQDSFQLPQLERVLEYQKALLLWSNACRTEELLSIWDEEDNHTQRNQFKKKKQAQYERQNKNYQHDSQLLEISYTLPFLLVIPLLESLPFGTFSSLLAEAREAINDLSLVTDKNMLQKKVQLACALGEVKDSSPTTIEALQRAITNESIHIDPFILKNGQLSYSLNETTPITRYAVASVLFKIQNKNQQALDIIHQDLERHLPFNWFFDQNVKDFIICYEAIQALGNSSSKDEVTLQILRKALRCSESELRGCAADAISQLGISDEETTRALEEALGNSFGDAFRKYKHSAGGNAPNVYWRIASTLLKIQPRNKRALYLFKRELNDSLACSAAEALFGIDIMDDEIIGLLQKNVRGKKGEHLNHYCSSAAVCFLHHKPGDKKSLKVLQDAFTHGSGFSEHDANNIYFGCISTRAARLAPKINISDDTTFQIIRNFMLKCSSRVGVLNPVVDELFLMIQAVLQVRPSDEDAQALLRVIFNHELNKKYRSNVANEFKYIAPSIHDENTIIFLIHQLMEEKDLVVSYALNITLLRILPVAYARLPCLVRLSVVQLFFVASVWLHASSVEINAENHQMVVDGQRFELSGTLTELQEFTNQMLICQNIFIDATALSSPSFPKILRILMQSIVFPVATNIFEESFLHDGLPVPPENSWQILFTRMDQINQRVTSLEVVSEAQQGEADRLGVECRTALNRIRELQQHAATTVSEEDVDAITQKMLSLESRFDQFVEAPGAAQSITSLGIWNQTSMRGLSPTVANNRV